jgi:hypothetical protein
MCSDKSKFFYRTLPSVRECTIGGVWYGLSKNETNHFWTVLKLDWDKSSIEISTFDQEGDARERYQQLSGDN